MECQMHARMKERWIGVAERGGTGARPDMVGAGIEMVVAVRVVGVYKILVEGAGI